METCEIIIYTVGPFLMGGDDFPDGDCSHIQTRQPDSRVTPGHPLAPEFACFLPGPTSCYTAASADKLRNRYALVRRSGFVEPSRRISR